MRSLRHSDVIAAARVLIAAAPEARAELCARLFDQADAADRFARKCGKTHPLWGNGTLLGAARAWPMREEPTFDDDGYRTAFAMVLAQVDVRKSRGRLVSGADKST